jgi:uncharacterized membrane protein YphA (DoxX/SURF4 family)
VIHWRPATRVAFRFAFIYFTLYTLAGQVFSGVFVYPGFAPMLGRQWPLVDITNWGAEHLFGGTPPFPYVGLSGDTFFHWVQTFWLLVFAAAGTAAWSLLDARRPNYVTLHKWFRLYLRFALAAQMFYYGMAKVLPTQFPPPALFTIVQPVGNQSLTDLLWLFIGASTPYQMFAGWAELAAGLLLIVPRLTTLGAILAMLDMVQVLVLNMTYDFGLKGIAFHYILMALFLLAPDLRRLADLFVFNRPVQASAAPELFRTKEANRLALVAQVVFGLYLVMMYVNVAQRYYVSEGGTGAPRSALRGIWDVERLVVDGEARHPDLNDYDRRWRRVIFDFEGRIFFQRTDDSFVSYGMALDESARRMTLAKGDSRVWRSELRYERPAEDQLILEGEIDGHDIRAELELVGLDTWKLFNSGFRWVIPNDPNALPVGLQSE